MEIIQAIQSTASPAADVFWGTISQLYGELVLMLFVLLVFWCISARFGWLLGNIILFNIAAFEIIKSLTNQPRPDPAQVRVIYEDTIEGSSFPSGHVEMASALWWTVAWGATVGSGQSQKHRWIWIVAAVMIVLVGISRLYIGAHWLVDVIAGAVFGTVLTGLALWGWQTWGRDHLDSSVIFRAVITLAPLVVFLLAPVGEIPNGMGILMGVNIGYLWLLPRTGSRDFPVRTTLMWQVVKLVIGWGILIGIRFALKAVFPETALFDFLRYVVMGIWAGWGAPLVFRRVVG